MITALCEQFKIQHHNSSPYRPKMNGAVEAANKNIKKIIQKMTVTYKDCMICYRFLFTGTVPQLTHQLGQHLFFSYIAWMLSCLLRSRSPLWESWRMLGWTEKIGSRLDLTSWTWSMRRDLHLSVMVRCTKNAWSKLLTKRSNARYIGSVTW